MSDNPEMKPHGTSKEIVESVTDATSKAIDKLQEELHKDASESVTSVTKESTAATKESRKYNFFIRTVWTFVMISGFFITLASGHAWCIVLILGCQIATFKECIAVTSASGREKNLPLTKTLNWYLLFTTIYYLDGKSLFKFFQATFYEYPVLNFIVTNHKFICYCLYLMGFVLFVCSLRKGFLKFQFGSLCVTHMVLLLVVFQAHLIIKNVLNGLFWFLLPCGLVIVNDIFAYLCGITFGKTKLIEISPKKTLEGFLGAWFFTALASIILTRILSPYTYLTCPVEDLHTNFFSNLTCELNPVFLPQVYRLPPIFFDKVQINSITVKPIYFHALNLATFASLFAPFGGFFASGLKRTFKVKDFGHSIPGHGGITDRVDCQFIMGSFANLYYETFISEHRITVDTVLSTILMNLNDKQIIELIDILIRFLSKKGIISAKNFEKLADIFNVTKKSLTNHS
ncbi:phosphatidate cytidylyltransferase [Saccharomyces cerevisiae RM11-1a]|uniref:Phosphatidate cytidylyltransferase n=1 Tax=Saccharomyces cerevisiae (strain RM11-1a) TaxID=285006 RepID=B3LNB5_YEAS1|nr:phosphatidate cytidylyltransferase [Saccharomyces cerevisiae RM11-1a]CAI4257349.1 CFS_G0002290.mRNA.1.CDS.1 [Saccharomyces cerevisiae]CAI7140871.1 CFS_G0002290.mRNA.1.CDS.1 [Saccharomyces cerevisiae]